MHRFWTVPELVDYALEEADPLAWPVMARVCQSFWAPASQLIWCHQRRFSNLLRLLPEEHRNVDRGFNYETGCLEYVDFIGDLQAADCTRLRQYASFVKYLEMRLDQTNYKALLQLHMHLNGEVLLPRLHKLEVEISFSEPGLISVQESRHIVDLLLGPSLTEIGWQHKEGWEASDEMAPAFFTRLQALPQLLYLRWEATTFPESAEESLHSFLSTAPHLDGFELSARDLPHATIRSASEVPDLRTASFSGFPNAEPSDPSPLPFPFPYLEELRFSGTRAGLDVALRQISAPQLGSLTIAIRLGNVTSNNILGALEDSQRFPALTTLVFHNYRLSPGDLDTVVTLKNLKVLRLHLCWTGPTSTFWPAWVVRKLAQSLHELEVLVLGDGCGFPADVAISLPELECLAKHCPKLERLFVATDARGMDTFDQPLVPHPTLWKVGLGHSEIDQHETEIGRVIYQLWPNLAEEFVISKALDDLTAAKSAWVPVWEEVARLRSIDLEAITSYLIVADREGAI
ncbi:hypothetical protein FRB90_006162 [Tulasnella sp. 427]|nr:hypothetical protein FRB90_006162 [Tulasnella sp. 427]